MLAFRPNQPHLISLQVPSCQLKFCVCVYIYIYIFFFYIYIYLTIIYMYIYICVCIGIQISIHVEAWLKIWGKVRGDVSRSDAKNTILPEAQAQFCPSFVVSDV